jgi:hypothetical protein
MICQQSWMSSTILVTAILAGTCAFGQERAGGEKQRAAKPRDGKKRDANAGSTTSPARKAPDYKVVFWLDRGQFRSRAYDVRKGQYTKAVQDWVDHQQYDSSGYLILDRLATVREVYLDREKGNSEAEKLEFAIKRELAKLENFDPSQIRWGTTPAQVSPVRLQPLRPVFVTPLPVPANTSIQPYPFPVPVPYPFSRPHP